MGSRPSPTWRSILKARPFLERGIRVRSLEFQGDSNWIPGQSPFHLPNIDSHTSMWSLFQLLKCSLQLDLFLVGLVICWKVWEVQNLGIHGDPRGFPSDVHRWSSEFLQSFREAHVTSSVVPVPLLPSSWEPPMRDMIKVNVDVAFPGNLDVFHTSLVARDYTDKCGAARTAGTFRWGGAGDSSWCSRVPCEGVAEGYHRN